MNKTAYMLIAVLLSVFCSYRAKADLLQDQMIYWRSQAFECKNSTGLRFASKVGIKSPNNPDGCDDGDMTLFNGLLCAAGETQGCDAVKASQDHSGRWWRSPRRVGIEHTSTNGEDDSFSPDQALGVLLFSITQSKSHEFQAWINWISDNRPCWIKPGSCILKGWPRYCPDDLSDKRCTFRPNDCAFLEQVGVKLSVPSAAVCKVALSDVGLNNKFDWPLEQMALGSAIVDDVGFPMHLAAVQIFILRKLGLYVSTTNVAAQIIALREPKNPFFQFLAQGNTQAVRDLTLSLCPKPTEPRTKRSQWAWERAGSEMAWKDSMYWDCIFMGRLLGAK